MAVVLVSGSSQLLGTIVQLGVSPQRQDLLGSKLDNAVRGACLY